MVHEAHAIFYLVHCSLIFHSNNEEILCANVIMLHKKYVIKKKIKICKVIKKSEILF